MKTQLLHYLAVAAFATAGFAAQQDMSPAPQVKKFTPLVGTFQGSGTVAMAPGGEAANWTATVRGEWILGGHFVQQDEDIQTPQGPLMIRSIYGWDREQQEFVCYGVSNMGPAPSDITWIDESTLVNVWHGTREGTPYVERWTMKFDDKGYAFTLDRGDGNGQFYNHVKGRFDRNAKPDAARAPDAASAAPGPELKLLQPMIGDWTLTGRVNVPGMNMDIAGSESIAWMYGGAVIAGHAKGEPEGSYFGDWYISYDNEAKCYRQLYASNLGEIGWEESHFVDGKFVSISANKQYGVPAVSRGVVEFADGGLSRAYADRIAGAGETIRIFQASYKRIGEPKTIDAKFSAGSCCAKAVAAGGTCAHPCCVAATNEGKICEKCNN